MMYLTGFLITMSIINAWIVPHGSQTKTIRLIKIENLATKRYDNSWNVPAYDVGVATELGKNDDYNSSNEKSSTLSIHEDISSVKNYYDVKLKRFCYFDRGNTCGHNGKSECRVDSRPCAADRSYLDHIYGSHNFPTIARMNVQVHGSSVNPSTSKPLSDNSVSPMSSSHRGQPNQNPTQPLSNNVPSSIADSTSSSLSTNKSHKWNGVSVSWYWIESTVVGAAKVVFRIIVAIVQFAVTRSFDNSVNDVKNKQNNKPNPIRDR